MEYQEAGKASPPEGPTSLVKTRDGHQSCFYQEAPNSNKGYRRNYLTIFTDFSTLYAVLQLRRVMVNDKVFEHH